MNRRRRRQPDPQTLPYAARIALSAIRDRETRIKELEELLRKERIRSSRTKIVIVIGLPPLRAWLRNAWLWLRVMAGQIRQPYF